MQERLITRRDAIARAAAGIAAPLVLPSWLRAQGSPNDTLRIGCIGVGRMGRSDMKAILKRGLDKEVNARIVAICDVDAARSAQAKTEVQKAYADAGAAAGEVATFGDFRDLLARDDIDGVTVGTPDFWHAGVAIEAARAKKDIYLQKPLTYSIVEGQKLVSAVRDNAVVLQTGSQQRSDARFRRACELVRNGRIGTLRHILVTLPPDKGVGVATEMPVPEPLDFDTWLGPMPLAPYTEHRVHPRDGYGRPGWLQIERYCRGMITGWGSHMNDIAQWGHGSDRDSGIVAIEASAQFEDRGLYDVHTTFRAEGRYADGVELVQETGDPAGVRFIGDDGEVFVRRGALEANPPSILDERIGEEEIHLPVSDDHYVDFLTAMRTREDPICPVEVGHRSNSLCIVTHIAMKLGRPLRWDPEAERFEDADDANAMLDFERRDPWTL